MSVEMFILVCLFPAPGLLVFHLTQVWKKWKRRSHIQHCSDIELNTITNERGALKISEREASQEEISLNMVEKIVKLSADRLEDSHVTSDSENDIATDCSADVKITECNEESVVGTGELKEKDIVDSKYAIIESLLKHYKPMKLCRVCFNWLAVHKIYRMILVACNTYISDSLFRLSTMTSVLLCIVLLHFLLRP